MFTSPVNNLRTLGLRDDHIVADLGAGTGFYTIALGHMVPRGKVYAVDIVKDFLATITHKAKEARLHNVEAIWGNIERKGGTKLRDGLVDTVIASNVLFQVEDKNKFIEEIKRILKPKGRVLLVDWSSGSKAVDFKIVVLKNKAHEMFKKQGFILEREINTGNHHYGMILIKS